MARAQAPFQDAHRASATLAGAAAASHDDHRLVSPDAEVARARARFKKGEIGPGRLRALPRRADHEALRWQEEIGLDVLVHGEFERNDMVEYFGEQLDGFAFTEHGWVQCYGSRCVKPPIIFGDVAGPRPMTVRWSASRSRYTEQAGEGHAHRTGDHPAVVVRARRPAARARPPPDRARASATR